ncbi:hypothetical protein RRV45_05930 [Bacillus sp. DTU_2020_1000418_1_SI_GHA_SEK_038]|uniref:hypothetical protein n=1 Tax=Bacillus sp. DTU_2020_1000418_1_SI_GHA_SEK_038 TaxID=3077585 RepID=UPI0028E34965|nr:hypothetical protein [Bacillus sp. DTU_2020_1000418_1_SI_GHA_SEK_038]WNS76545.1 hypothetical protein RRV45_05930 [Bacillus sp. DTU_2020_1000418_1_SI_GHA_SEK_038]
MKINLEMEKANMLAKQIVAFIKYVRKSCESKNSVYPNPDKLYQIKLLIDEFKFQIIAEELQRINRFSWDEKYTYYLVDEFQKGLNIMEEYVRKNIDDLFILSARLYTLSNLTLLIRSKK